MLNIVLISHMMIRMRSMISRNCLFFSMTASVSSRFSCRSFLYSSLCTGSGLWSGSSFKGIRLSMCVYSIPAGVKCDLGQIEIDSVVETNGLPCWQLSLHLSYNIRSRLNSKRMERNCSVTFFSVVVAVADGACEFVLGG